MKVKEEHEIRLIITDPTSVLSAGRNKKEYTLVDTYYLPENGQRGWRLEERNLRLRKFGHGDAELILSLPEFKGIVKHGKKYFIASGTEQLLAEVLRNLGFMPCFKIERKQGYFLDYQKWNIALEEIEGIGWTIDADVESEEDAWKLIEALQGSVREVLKEPLPAYYCKTFNIDI
ncbi:MAG: hypothetical protein QXJ27_04910 [Thermoplasmata archaeon]